MRIIINVGGGDFARRSNKTLLSRLRTKRYTDAMRGGYERERERRGESTFCNRQVYRAADGVESKVNRKLEKYSWILQAVRRTRTVSDKENLGSLCGCEKVISENIQSNFLLHLYYIELIRYLNDTCVNSISLFLDKFASNFTTGYETLPLYKTVHHSLESHCLSSRCLNTTSHELPAITLLL